MRSARPKCQKMWVLKKLQHGIFVVEGIAQAFSKNWSSRSVGISFESRKYTWPFFSTDVVYGSFLKMTSSTVVECTILRKLIRIPLTVNEKIFEFLLHG